MMMMMTVIVMLVIVLAMVLRRHRGANRVQRPAQASRLADKALALDPDEPRAEQRDQRVAGQLDDAARVAHLACGGVEDDRRDADERHRDERLQKCRGERQHDAAPPCFLVGDEIRRNHRLAVARPGGVEDAVQKRHAEQGPHRAAVGLGGTDDARKVLVKLGLLGKNPADDAVGGWRRPGAPRGAPNGVPCAKATSRTPAASRYAAVAAKSMSAIAVRPPATLVRDISPKSCWRTPPRSCYPEFFRPAESPPASAPSPWSFPAPGEAYLAAGRRLLQAYRILLDQGEVNEIAWIEHLEIERLRLHRRFQRQHEVQRQHRILGD